jgi:hypothetical protein
LLNLNLKDKLKRNLEIEVVSPVSQAVSEMIEIIWKKIQMMRIIVQVILAAQARHAAKKRVKWSNKTVMGGGGLPGSFLIVQSKILQNAKCILSRRFGRRNG